MINQLEALSVDMGYSAGILALFYKVAISYGIAPLVIFMGVGAMTDFGPLLANPKTLLLGAAAQFGIFATVLGALALNYFGIIEFTPPQAASIGIIGGADGPTAIYLTSKLAPELLGAIAGGSLFLYGISAIDSTTDYESVNHRRRTSKSARHKCAM